MQTLPRPQINTVSLYSHAGQRKYLNDSERRRFIAAASECERANLRTLCLVLAYTGCRLSEALNLVSAYIECDDALIALRCLKKREKQFMVRQVPVPIELIAEIRAAHDLSNPFARLWPWSRSRAWQLVKAVMAQACITPGIHATPKGLRHGFGVHATRSGVPLNLVQRWMGHASMTTTAIYLQVVGPEERELAERMWH